MNELQIFNNPEFGEVRTIQIDGDPWFVGKDVATALGYANPNEAVQDHVDDEDKLNSKTLPGFDSKSTGLDLGQRGNWLVNESGVYALIFGSKLESAKRFKHWVTSEVLPAIRKTGTYTARGPWEQAVQDAVRSVRTVRAAMEAQGIAEETILKAVKDIARNYGVELPEIVLNPKSLTLDDTFDMIDFIYSHERGRGHRKPTIEDFLIHRSKIKALES